MIGSRPLVCGGRLYNGRTENGCFSLINGGTEWKALRGMKHKRRFASAVTFQDEGVYPQLSRFKTAWPDEDGACSDPKDVLKRGFFQCRQDVFLVTGGRDETDAVTNSTEFLKKGFFFSGFELPAGGAEGHCLIRLNDTHVFLSGGGSGRPRLPATRNAFLWEFGHDETSWQQVTGNLSV